MMNTQSNNKIEPNNKTYLDLDIWDDSNWLRSKYEDILYMGNLGSLKSSIRVKSKNSSGLMTRFMNAFSWLDGYIIKHDRLIILSDNFYSIEFTIISKT